MFEERIKFIKEAIDEIDFNIQLEINHAKNIPYFKSATWDVEYAKVNGALEALREIKRHFELSLAVFSGGGAEIKKCRLCGKDCPEGEKVWTLATTTAQYCMNHCHYGSDDVLHLECVKMIEGYMMQEVDILDTQLERD